MPYIIVVDSSSYLVAIPKEGITEEEFQLLFRDLASCEIHKDGDAIGEASFLDLAYQPLVFETKEEAESARTLLVEADKRIYPQLGENNGYNIEAIYEILEAKPASNTYAVEWPNGFPD